MRENKGHKIFLRENKGHKIFLRENKGRKIFLRENKKGKKELRLCIQHIIVTSLLSYFLLKTFAFLLSLKKTYVPLPPLRLCVKPVILGYGV
ncbi:hypothetical protein CTE07_50260 [Chitinophaga terrae (ex Kim and Jung 2007)]|nr:hypothetical protein CTE07_50260 [Chitinophaga terrae (ex Kim and Jung 2007)]